MRNFSNKALTLLALACTVSSLTISNKCVEKVYYDTVTTASSAPSDLIGAGESVVFSLPTTVSSSVHLSTTSNYNTFLAFERSASGSDVFYDLSEVNGNPFAGSAVVAAPSIDTCSTVTCSPAVNECYTSPTDDGALFACPGSPSFTITLCA